MAMEIKKPPRAPSLFLTRAHVQDMHTRVPHLDVVSPLSKRGAMGSFTGKVDLRRNVDVVLLWR